MDVRVLIVEDEFLIASMLEAHLVRLAGIEPTTPWFVAKYSIQLSYSRTNYIITEIGRAHV